MEAGCIPRTSRVSTFAFPGFAVLVANLALGVAAVTAQQSSERIQATAEVMDSNGGSVGTVKVRQLAKGTLFVVDLKNLPPGAHAFHVHERGVCEPPDFKSAGGHYGPVDNKHGLDNEQGYHAGDLPNIHATQNGAVKAELFAHQLALETDRPDDGGQGGDAQQQGGGSPFAAVGAAPFSLRDDDGSAIMVHRNPDDYKATPPDSSGPRIACGVIQSPGGTRNGSGGG